MHPFLSKFSAEIKTLNTVLRSGIGGPSGHDRDMIGLYTDTQFLKLWGDSQNTVLPRKHTRSELSQAVLCLLSSLLPSVKPFPQHHQG